jgi:hypothetical protein
MMTTQNMMIPNQQCFLCNGTGQITKLKIMTKVCPACNGTRILTMPCMRCPKCQGDGKEYPLLGRKGIPFECKLCIGKGYVTEMWIPCQVCLGEGKLGDLIPKKCDKCNGNGFFKGNIDGMNNMMGYGNVNNVIAGTQPMINQPPMTQQFINPPVMGGQPVMGGYSAQGPYQGQMGQPMMGQPMMGQPGMGQPMMGQGYSSTNNQQTTLKDII